MYAPRLGQIGFLNCATIGMGLLRQPAARSFSVIEDAPVGLARRLADGELDVASISAIEYLRNTRDYVLIPGVAIASSGPVMSVNLFTRSRPESLSGTIATTDASTTSRVLLEILLKDHWRSQASTAPKAIDGDVLAEAEAALMIGDQALRAAQDRPEGCRIVDLGQAWKDCSGSDMVFALWAARRDFAERDPQGLAEIAGALRGAVAWASANREMAARLLAAKHDLPTPLLIEYYERLRLDFDADALCGLREFAERAHAHGLLEEVPEPTFAGGRPMLVEAA